MIIRSYSPVSGLFAGGARGRTGREAGPGATGLKVICECSPDIAVIDLSLPDMSGIELARKAGKRCPEVKIIVLTVHEDRAYIHPVLEAGAGGIC